METFRYYSDGNSRKNFPFYWEIRNMKKMYTFKQFFPKSIK